MVIYHTSDVMVMLVEIEVVLLAIIAFLIGLMSITLLNKYRSSTTRTIAEYEGRFKEYEDMLVDLKIRLDAQELRARNGDIMSQQSQGNHDACDTDNHIKPKVIRRTLEEGSGLMNYVLKLLLDDPMTSRQIESNVGRSREHTARLMKRLFELGYVTRDVSVKPYTYTISDAGRTVVSQVVSAKIAV